MSANTQITVIGAGLMGHGIALSFARHSYEVLVHDPDPSQLSSLSSRVSSELTKIGVTEHEPVLDRIKAVDQLEDAARMASMVIEAVPERLELKQEVFARIEAVVSKECLLASNTSVIPITKIMGGLMQRNRCLGTHWWNPPHQIPLVEVIRTEWTDNQTMDKVVDLLSGIGKKPVRVEKDVPGFIGNRLQHAMWREAISLVENGVCDAEAIDNVVKSSFGLRLPVLGPLENADLIGTDLTLDIHNQIFKELEDSHEPSPYLSNLVSSGKIGMKTGEGFRQWENSEGEQVKTRLAKHLLTLD